MSDLRDVSNLLVWKIRKAGLMARGPINLPTKTIKTPKGKKRLRRWAVEAYVDERLLVILKYFRRVFNPPPSVHFEVRLL
jgi:ribosomal protein S10